MPQQTLKNPEHPCRVFESGLRRVIHFFCGCAAPATEGSRLRNTLASVVLAGFCITLFAACASTNSPSPSDEKNRKVPMAIVDLSELKQELISKYDGVHNERLQKGIERVAGVWRPEDGDLRSIVQRHFITEDQLLDETFSRIEDRVEQLDGLRQELMRELRWHTDVDTGPLLPVDASFAGIDPSAHTTEDLFQSGVAFTTMLNYTWIPLKEQSKRAKQLSRRQWAEIRLNERFLTRVPALDRQHAARVNSAADLYVSGYNIWMHHVLTEKGERLFPKGMRLISHWNLRDEIKAAYSDPQGLPKQRLVYEVMKKIVTQTIPSAVIDDPRVDWVPNDNRVRAAPAETLPSGVTPLAKEPSSNHEADIRYAHWLAQFRASQRIDAHAPQLPTALSRSFTLHRRLTKERAVALLREVVTSPQVKSVAEAIRKRLGRPLEPHDIWYDGFLSRASYSPEELDEVTRARYPDARSFEDDIPRILKQLGFDAKRAEVIANRIAVDEARGAGHAMEAKRRGDKPRLRTRVSDDGMDYKGYNIAVHELGHNVEQVISLYDVDHTLLQGVPNNAFTEAMAFLFQRRDLALLGLEGNEPQQEHLDVLNTFWMTYEIAGVALVDIEVWDWLYDHPDATPAELRGAVLAISRGVWNDYYEPVLGGRNSPLLAIYSHLIAYPLYVIDYPLGHLIAFQIEQHVGNQPLGPHIERMARLGCIDPDAWMLEATGSRLSAQPLLRATVEALGAL